LGTKQSYWSLELATASTLAGVARRQEKYKIKKIPKKEKK